MSSVVFNTLCVLIGTAGVFYSGFEIYRYGIYPIALVRLLVSCYIINSTYEFFYCAWIKHLFVKQNSKDKK